MREADRLFDGFGKKLATLLKTGVVSDSIGRSRSALLATARRAVQGIADSDDIGSAARQGRSRLRLQLSNCHPSIHFAFRILPIAEAGRRKSEPEPFRAENGN
jgi:hypothetical protein